MSPESQPVLDPGELSVLLKGANLSSAPQPLLRRAERLFDAATAERPTIRQVIATLMYDSFVQPALAGARGAAASSRQMVLRAEGFDIHLKISGDPSRRLAGQVLARGESSFINGTRLHLLRDGERFVSTDADKFGEFEFELVPDGFVSLQVDLPHLTVVGTLSASEAA